MSSRSTAAARFRCRRRLIATTTITTTAMNTTPIAPAPSITYTSLSTTGQSYVVHGPLADHTRALVSFSP